MHGFRIGPRRSTASRRCSVSPIEQNLHASPIMHQVWEDLQRCRRRSFHFFLSIPAFPDDQRRRRVCHSALGRP